MARHLPAWPGTSALTAAWNKPLEKLPFHKGLGGLQVWAPTQSHRQPCAGRLLQGWPVLAFPSPLSHGQHFSTAP